MEALGIDVGWYIVPYKRLYGFPFPSRICEMNDYDVIWSEVEIDGNNAIVKVRGKPEILKVLDIKYKKYKDINDVLLNETMNRRMPRYDKQTDTIFLDGKIVDSESIVKLNKKVMI